ncbi:hypothetical protein BLGI_2944 [Brevibacillus laterosporus GI-9]|nr:hypothetical protein BLGI_2944 [Brevibacillus laterosporus GI-9]
MIIFYCKITQKIYKKKIIFIGAIFPRHWYYFTHLNKE